MEWHNFLYFSTPPTRTLGQPCRRTHALSWQNASALRQCMQPLRCGAVRCGAGSRACAGAQTSHVKHAEKRMYITRQVWPVRSLRGSEGKRVCILRHIAFGSCAVPCMLRTGVPGKSAEVRIVFDAFHLRDG